ncbi:MAG: hypothetical protein GC179_02200 [Anaerolineaceae bacterium]|nr:hypothetical protein [Anaerolineaceae bacterium]
MNNVSKIALLKLIRENQPISLNEIAILIESNNEMQTSFPYRHLLDNIRGYPKHPVEDLLRFNLIETKGGVEFTPDIKLLSSSIVPRLQELFRFSLTKLIEAGENPMQVTPIFKQPLPDRKSADVFVAMPFRDDLKPVYTDHILKVATELRIRCKRGDDFFTANRIMDDVWSAIYHARLCIVDCTDRNPNVFYELGIAHTLGRKAILISKTIDDIPFDVRDLRTIVYNYTVQGMQEFEQSLKRTIQQELGLNA